MVGKHRSTQRHPVKAVELEDANLRHRFWVIVDEHIRWGRRMVYRLLTYR